VAERPIALPPEAGRERRHARYSSPTILQSRIGGNLISEFSRRGAGGAFLLCQSSQRDVDVSRRIGIISQRHYIVAPKIGSISEPASASRSINPTHSAFLIISESARISAARSRQCLESLWRFKLRQRPRSISRRSHQLSVALTGPLPAPHQHGDFLVAARAPRVASSEACPFDLRGSPGLKGYEVKMSINPMQNVQMAFLQYRYRYSPPSLRMSFLSSIASFVRAPCR